MTLRALPPRPLVTVLTAAYDYERYVTTAVRSVLAQTYGRLEHIVVDDGSTDGTAAAVQALAAADGRVRLLQVDNAGQTAAFNTAFTHAAGDIIAFLDADDRFHPDKLATIVHAFTRAPTAGFVTHKLREVDADGRVLDVYPPVGKMAQGWCGPAMLRSGGFLVGLSSTSGVALHRTVADAILPLPTTTRAADTLILALAPLLTEVVGIDRPLVDYRWHGQNLTAGDASPSTEIDRRLAAQESAWAAQRDLLRVAAPHAAGELTSLDHSRYIAELRYTRARLTNSPEHRELHRRLRRNHQFHAQPRLRRAFWTAAPLLPPTMFTAVHRRLCHPGDVRRLLHRLRRGPA